MAHAGLDLPIFVGGKLLQIIEDEDGDDQSSTPVDVTGQLRALGAIVCHQVEDMLTELLRMARESNR
jgi:hypothetical protein